MYSGGVGVVGLGLGARMAYALSWDCSKSIIMNICMTSPADPPERISERKIWKQSVGFLTISGRWHFEGAFWGAEDSQMEWDFQDNAGTVWHRRKEWEAMPRTLPQSLAWRHQQGEMDGCWRGPAYFSTRVAWEPMGAHFQVHRRTVRPFLRSTENCVKNMLYSRLRKAIRQLNRFVFLRHRKEMKEIKLPFVYRLI